MLARKDESERQFSLQDVLEAAQSADAAFFQASSAERIFQCVTSITQILQKYGAGALRGDVDAFYNMAKVRECRGKELTNAVMDRPIRETAEIAWTNKDFGEVRRLYESVHGDLTATEERRLNYAVAQLGMGTDPNKDEQ